MFVKQFAACGAVLLSSIVAIGLCSSGSAAAADDSDTTPINPVLEGSLQTSEAHPNRYREAMEGTPDQSLWRAPPGGTQRSPTSEPRLPALDKPMTLFNGLFKGSETNSSPHP